MSQSVEAHDYALQRDATAEALRAPVVARAAADGIALSAIMWGSRQTVVMPWRILRDAETASQAADELARAERPESGYTAVGLAIEAGLNALAAAPCEAERRVLDISGDGPNNEGPPVARAVERAVAMDVQINALPIVTEQAPGMPDLAEWYRANVTDPTGGFLIAADWPSFGRAIRLKLSAEVAALE